MRKRNQWMLSLLIITLMMGFSNCGKYEEGPTFTLTTKTARLTGKWMLMKYNGLAVASPVYQEFKKGGDYKITMIINSLDVSYDGTWKWGTKKDAVEVTLLTETVEMQVIRLTNDEFWFKDEDGKLWELDKQ